MSYPGDCLTISQGPPALPNQLPHERERAAVEKAPAEGDRRAVGNERGQLGKRQDLGCGHAAHGSVEEP